MEIKNLKKASQRILKAIQDKERIIIYGDADLDGSASVVMLKETIENLGGKVSSVYFVDRGKEGYGINEKALNILKPLAPALFITLDLGVTSFKETDTANQMGFEVIIIDHHQVLDSLPKASIIIDPKQKKDNYPFKDLATVGVVYRLARLMFGNKMSEEMNNSLLELTALATIADMMPKEKENKEYIRKGLQSLRNTQRIGLKIFFKLPFLKRMKEGERIQRLVSILNVSQIKRHLTEAYLFLISQDEEEVEELRDSLLERSRQRKELIKEVVKEVEGKINEEVPSVIFEGDVGWPNTLVGTIASRVCNKYKRPTFIYRKMKEESVGSVRMPAGLDAVKAMKTCEKLLITFGGHAPAAGFRLKNKNLKEFQKCLIEYFEPCVIIK